MKTISLVPALSFILLVLAQVMVFNHLHIFGKINPMLYLLFFFVYRFESDQTALIGLAFLLGFSVDFLSQTGGCLLYTSPSPRDATLSRMPSSA